MKKPPIQDLTPVVAVMVAVASVAGVAQRQGSTYGPGHCGPLDPAYVRVSNATGGQVLPLGPTEIAGAASLMSASSGTELVSWTTGTLGQSMKELTIPVDAITSRIALTLSTDGAIEDMTIRDAVGTPVAAGMAGVEAPVFGCVRSVIVQRPAAGTWTIRAMGRGRFWLSVHARSDLALSGEFVRVAGRPGHEGLFRIPGQPVAGRPATLRARLDRDQIADATFDLVGADGEPLQAVVLSPASLRPDEEEYIGEVPVLPAASFRLRVRGRDRSGVAYQRVTAAAFQAATLEVVADSVVEAERGQRVEIKVSVRNVSAPARVQLRAVVNATQVPVEPSLIQLGTNQSRDARISIMMPSDAVRAEEQLIITAESTTSEAASNSAIIRVVPR